MYQQENGPAVFVNGELKQSKNGNYFVSFKTVDLVQITKELNTSVVSMVLTKPKNARTETERLLVIKPGDQKYLSKGKSNGAAKEQPTQESILI